MGDFIAAEQKENLKTHENSYDQGRGRQGVERKGKEGRKLHVPSILLYKLAPSQTKTMKIVLSSLLDYKAYKGKLTSVWSYWA